MSKQIIIRDILSKSDKWSSSNKKKLNPNEKEKYRKADMNNCLVVRNGIRMDIRLKTLLREMEEVKVWNVCQTVW